MLFNLHEGTKVNVKEELNEWGYPIHPKSDYSKPPEGNFVSWVGVILVFTEISWKNIVFLAMVMQCFWRKNHSDLIERCFESRKIKKARMGNSIKPVLIEVTSAIRPTKSPQV